MMAIISRSLVGVYNPFSVCNALANLRLNSYWIASGSNEMLLKVLRKFINEIPELDNCLIDSDYLEMSDVNMNDQNSSFISPVILQSKR